VNTSPPDSNQPRTSAPTVTATAVRPEFFPIPQKGADSFFGLGRSSYYDLERRGLLRLVRVRKPGQVRGKVLIPFEETAACLRKLQGGRQ
jgi:hypothetical protein